jgi:hypothetical protein
LHSEHLKRFLDIDAFARELKRDARAAQQKLQDDEEASQREQDARDAQLRATELIHGTKQPTGPLSPGGSSNATDDEDETEDRGKARNRRRHPRSRRMGPKQQEELDEDQPILPGFGGASVPLGNNWGRGSRYEGREGRERG